VGWSRLAESSPKSQASGDGRPKRKWYKDRTYIFMIGVFAMASSLLIIQAQQQRFNQSQEDTGVQLLIGQNKTLILVNKTAAVILGNDTTIVGRGESDSNTLTDVKNLLASVNNTLSNPNRTIKTNPINKIS
jgi:hypothetical protein